MNLNKKGKIILVIIIILSVLISSLIAILITKNIINKNSNKQEEIISKLNGGWKSKDDTRGLILGGDYGLDYDIQTSAYIYINNTYAYNHSKLKKDFTIIDNSHLQIGDWAQYFYFKDDNTLIIGDGEYIRVNNLLEEDFSCYGEYPCSIYTK